MYKNLALWLEFFGFFVFGVLFAVYVILKVHNKILKKVLIILAIIFLIINIIVHIRIIFFPKLETEEGKLSEIIRESRSFGTYTYYFQTSEGSIIRTHCNFIDMRQMLGTVYISQEKNYIIIYEKTFKYIYEIREKE